MNVNLPNSHLRISESFEVFFGKLIKTFKLDDSISIKLIKPNSYRKNTILEFRNNINSFYVQLINSEKNQYLIQLEARGWRLDHVQSYKEYTDVLKQFSALIIKKYNQINAVRYRISVQSEEDCNPRLPPKARKAFDLFINLSVKNDLNRSEWKHFYCFAKTCHTYRAKTNEDDVFRLLVLAGYEESSARKFAILFGHLRAFQRF